MSNDGFSPLSPLPRMMEVGQRRQVYDRGSGNRWYVDITDEFLRERGRHGIDINDPNLNRNGDVIIVEPLDPSQDLVIADEYVETPGGRRLHAFPLNEQIHYGFIVPGLERQHEERVEPPFDRDNAADRNRHISAMWHSRRNSMHEQAQRRQTGGRTRRRKCKGKGKCKKTVKTRKCIRAHK